MNAHSSFPFFSLRHILPTCWQQRNAFQENPHFAGAIHLSAMI
ncbi:hypothetical protein HMPREF0880_00319 [Yokenella regensburgei ATCC 43003]|nr:hypothetical protein HMPREF0880_00319 [Yokenella regensburgei ATCC 43003]